jgi:4-diphosphocytidyl-2-C-methyl-D-erythritol kinase
MKALYDLPAPAKLNLFLHVIGRRADGHHLLQSVFTLIDWCDLLHFERRDDSRLQRHDLGPELPADDLCLRAARALQSASGTRQGVDISIDKRVPCGAGLGGGSSDAATTLLALNRLWGLCWPRERLLELTLALGADVPFFVGGRNAFVEGVGERLTPLDLPTQHYLVVKPEAGVATAQAFASPDLVRDTGAVILDGCLASTVSAPGYGRNDLQPVAEALCPQVRDAAVWLDRHCGNSRMSGSGSAVFARVGIDDQPLPDVSAWPPTWVVRRCRGLARHPLWGWTEPIRRGQREPPPV